MRTPQLFCIVGALAAVMGCSRAETDARTDQAAAEARSAAVNARERLADAWLVTKIQSQYFADEDVKARYIHVAARDGVVTLRGRVDSPAEHEQALQIAKSTDGVTRVDDRLTVTSGAAETAPTEPSASGGVVTSGSAPPVPQPIDDAQIIAGVQSKFFLDDQVKSRRIDVDARQGVVTLQGQVANESERSRALLLARDTEGVQRVEDHLTVDPTLMSGAVGATGTAGATGAAGAAGTPGATGAPAAPGAPGAAAAPGASAPAGAAAAPGSSAPAGGAPAPVAPAPAVSDDATVTTTIQARYFLDSAVKQGNIEVSSKDGVVLLQGTVPTEAAHQQAVAIARTTEGVVQVVDRIQVAKPAARPRRR